MFATWKRNRWAVGKPRSMRNGAQVLIRRPYRCAGPPGVDVYPIATGMGRWNGCSPVFRKRAAKDKGPRSSGFGQYQFVLPKRTPRHGSVHDYQPC